MLFVLVSLVPLSVVTRHCPFIIVRSAGGFVYLMGVVLISAFVNLDSSVHNLTKFCVYRWFRASPVSKTLLVPLYTNQIVGLV